MYTILHVDSSYFFRKIFKDKFESEGINYIGVSSLSEARNELMYDPKINIILTAVEFEDENVEEFIEELSNSKYKNIPIFVITGNTSTQKRIEIFNLGIVDYILKNTPIDEIVENILAFTRESELLQELRKAKIAVLDDSKFEIMRLEDIFKANNIQNIDFYTEIEDLENSNEKYDIYLIDMVLKNRSGEDMILKIREEDKYCPILAVSSIANAKTISHVLLTGANDYIVKPYVQEVLLARMEIALRNYLIIKELLNK